MRESDATMGADHEQGYGGHGDPDSLWSAVGNALEDFRDAGGDPWELRDLLRRAVESDPDREAEEGRKELAEALRKRSGFDAPTCRGKYPGRPGEWCTECLLLAASQALAQPSPDSPGDLTDAKAAYMNLRTCICGADARDHECPQPPRGGGFDPDWIRVREELEARQARRTDAPRLRCAHPETCGGDEARCVSPQKCDPSLAPGTPHE